MKQFAAITLLVVAVITTAWSAQTPAFNYQGKLTDPFGVPLAGSHTLYFSVFQGGSAGTANSGALVYSEEANVSATNGVVNHIVGTGSNPSPGLFDESMLRFSGDIFLQVAIDNGSNVVLPRTKLVPVPFAVRADFVEQVVRSFPVAEGETVAAGDVVSLDELGQARKGFVDELTTSPEVTFSSGAAAYEAVVPLTQSEFVALYMAPTTFDATAVIGTVNGDAITFGTGVPYSSGNCLEISGALLSSNQIVSAFYDTADSSKGKAQVVTISGSTITPGSDTTFNDAATAAPHVAALSAGTVVVAYRDTGNANHGTAIAATVSGSTLTFGTELDFNAASTGNMAIAPLSATQFVVAYIDTGGGNAVKARVGTVSGTTISYGNVLTVATGAQIAVSPVSSTQFVLIYPGGSGHVAVLCTVSGPTITPGIASDPFVTGPTFLVAAQLSGDRFVVAYRDDNSFPAYGKATVGTLSGGVATFKPSVIFNTANTSYVSVGGLWPQRAVVAYRDDSNGNLGTAALIDVAREPVGIARTAAVGGQKLPVILHGVSDVHSGLSVGAKYYALPDGSLSMNGEGHHKAGVAISTTEILLPGALQISAP